MRSVPNRSDPAGLVVSMRTRRVVLRLAMAVLLLLGLAGCSSLERVVADGLENQLRSHPAVAKANINFGQAWFFETDSHIEGVVDLKPDAPVEQVVAMARIIADKLKDRGFAKVAGSIEVRSARGGVLSFGDIKRAPAADAVDAVARHWIAMIDAHPQVRVIVG